MFTSRNQDLSHLPILRWLHIHFIITILLCIFSINIKPATASPSNVLVHDAVGSSPVELHIVTLTLKDHEQSDLCAKRRTEEKQQLMNRLVRRKGCTDRNHPRARLLTALHAFSRYEERNRADLRRWRDNYGHLSKHQKKVLEKAVKYSSKLSRTEQMIRWNHDLCLQIVDAGLVFYEISREELDQHIKAVEARGEVAERVSVNQALKHYVRDWSQDGAHERKTFPCILETITQYSLGTNRSMENPLRVLVPGAGLARLGFEIENLGGFEVTVNEWSMYMNVAYRFIESLPIGVQHKFHPFIDSWSHHATTEDMHRAVGFPDRPLSPSNLVMIEGDFATVIGSHKNQYDFVVTHFFIDTARNLMSYFETIQNVLRQDGYWINSGPLLYGTGPWIQLALDEIVVVVEELGFELMDMAERCGDLTFPDKKVRWMPGIYGSNERALHMNGYRVQCWVARKR